MQRAVSWPEEMTSYVLGSIKETIHHVQEDITSSFKKLKVTDNRIQVRTDDLANCNLNAGDEILHKFQQHWADTHQEIEVNSRKAKIVNRLTEEIFDKCQHQSQSIQALTKEVRSLPTFLESLNDLSLVVGKLHGVFEEVESQLLYLENIMEQLELEDLQLHHRLQLASYREKRRADLDLLQQHLDKDYKAKVHSQAEKEKKILMERSETFHKEFQDDLQQFKESGKLEKVRVSESCESTSDVAQDRVDVGDIEIDDTDRTELDKFLDDGDNSTGEFSGGELHVSVSDGEKSPRLSQPEAADETESRAE